VARNVIPATLIVSRLAGRHIVVSGHWASFVRESSVKTTVPRCNQPYLSQSIQASGTRYYIAWRSAIRILMLIGLVTFPVVMPAGYAVVVMHAVDTVA
jgi:hypothetical protein